MIELEVRVKYIRRAHRGDGPELSFERLCSRLTKLSPSHWSHVEISIGPDFWCCPNLRCSAGLQPGTCRPKGRRYVQIRTAPDF